MNAESPTPARSLPGKQELLAFQATWMRRAGVAAVLGGFIVAAAVVSQQVGLHLPSGNSDADQLVFEHAHASRLIYSSILLGIGIVLFVAPLLFLFRAAAGRAQRVRSGFVGLIVLGPIALGIGVVISSIGSAKAADDFHAQEPAAIQQARQQAAQAQAAEAKPSHKTGTAGGGTSSAKPTPSTTTPTASTTASTTINLNGTTTTVPTPVTPDQAGGNARENLADHINKHTTSLLAGGFLSFVGKLSLVFGLIYTSLWSMRVGLLSRFWGVIGMAAGAGLILLGPIGIALMVLWFAAIGLMFIGVWPRPLAPAWAAGEAIPWLKPGEDIGTPTEPGSGGTVEGSGREVSETPLPEDGAPNGEPTEPPTGETQGQRRKKRKRRG